MKLLCITHNCCLAGAQQSFLRILHWLVHNTDWDIRVLALGDGPLAEEYTRLAPFLIIDNISETAHNTPQSAADQEHFQQIAAFLNGKPDCIWGNSAVSAKIYPLLAPFASPVVTRVAELESSLERYLSPHTLASLIRYSEAYIAVSRQVAHMLAMRFNVPEQAIHIINGAVSDTQTTTDIPRRQEILQLPGMPGMPDMLSGMPVLWGCGSISRRKGSDLFLETAEALLARGKDNFRCLWAGHPEDDLVRQLFLTKERSPAKNHVLFVGNIPQPAHVMIPGDLFLMTSREDPFPLVCLEAAERGVPSLCFPDTGGAVDFIAAGGGYVAQNRTPQALADIIVPLLDKPEERIQKGQQAQTLVRKKHTMDSAGPLFAAVFSSLRTTQGK